MIYISYYKHFTGMINACWQILFLALPAIVVTAIALAVLPVLVQEIVHASFVENDTATIQTTLLAITLLLAIRSLADYVSYHLIRKAENRLCMQLCNALFSNLLNQPAQYYQSLDIHQATDTALTAIQQVSRSTMQTIVIFARDSLTVISLLLCLAWLDKNAALLIILLIPFIVIMLQVMAGQHNADRHTDDLMLVRLTKQLQRTIANFRQVRLYGGQQQEYKRLKKDAQSMQDHEMQQANHSAFIVMLCQLIFLLIVMAVTYLTIQQALRNTLALDQISAFVTAILLMIAPIKRLAGLPQALRNDQKYSEQIFAMLEQHPASDHDNRRLPESRGELMFEHAGIFCQKTDKPLLYTIDRVINPGETVAFVCESPQLRSLLIDLILGFHQPVTGKMRIDGHPYSEIKHEDVLAQFAMVSNEPVVLSDTVASNIAYGITQCASEASITSAAQAAGASFFVREMPDGLQTHVDESGASLTRQQWQKIGVARALLKNAPVLLIDDLWPQTDPMLITDALIPLMQKRTTIILMHAMPIVREHIDRVFLLQDGVITEK